MLCHHCNSGNHILQFCPKLRFVYVKSNSCVQKSACFHFQRKDRKKMSAFHSNKKVVTNNINLAPDFNPKIPNSKITYFQKGTLGTFVSSIRGTKTQRDPISLERFPSNFSTIKKNITCPLISTSSCDNEILLLNCLNSPLALKKMANYLDSPKKIGTLNTNSTKYNDVNESNRVYYDKHGDTIDNDKMIVETVNSQLSRVSDRPQFKSETNRTSEIIEEYSELMSKNTKPAKNQTNPNPSQYSQKTSHRMSSFSNFDQNLAWTNSSKNIQSKENRSNKSSRTRQTNERRYVSSNSLLTQTQAVLNNYIEKLSKTYEKKTEVRGTQKKDKGEFEIIRSFKFYFPENNIENVIKR